MTPTEARVLAEEAEASVRYDIHRLAAALREMADRVEVAERGWLETSAALADYEVVKQVLAEERSEHAAQLAQVRAEAVRWCFVNTPIELADETWESVDDYLARALNALAPEAR